MRFFGTIVLLASLPLLGRGDDVSRPDSKPGTAWHIPFRLTDVKHILVRARINGKGPYNFIVDTGAPALFVSTAVCKKLGVEPGKDGWGTFDRFEIEGGAVIDRAKGRIADPFQLDGINRMGLAGVELHGVIGYNILARYLIELDFTRDKMVWTRLQFEPPLPQALEGKAPGGMEAMAGLAKLMSLLVGKRGRETRPRGFLGIELVEKKGTLEVVVVKDGPADQAGIQNGDCITHFQEQEVKSPDDLYRLAESIAEGDQVKLQVRRGNTSREVKVTAGKGF
jgi:hypothetical protein